MNRRFATALISLSALLMAFPASADLALATSKNCMGCHALERKVLGPSFKDIAAKYRDDKSAPEKLTSKVLKGGSGAWGAVVMPANPQVSEADAKKLVAWVLSTK